MALVDGFLELERSSGKLEWSAILQKMASDLGFSKILFGLLPKDSQDYENAFIVGNYPAAWREHYDRAGYARVDPTVSHCTQSVLPIFWEPSIYQTRKQHEFFEEASAAGLVYGLTMPLHGARGELGALSLSVEAENRAEANRFMESVLPTLWMLKDYALQSGGSDQPGEGSVAVVRHRQDQLGDIGYLQLLGSQCELPYGKYSAEVRCDLPPRSGHYGR
ncbi:transcriptional activator protein lasR [Pseudomonas aeruginosa BWHPSA018]|nr:transcriptional activator protein lasR [Pseudomonas aeruginosa BWHPSA018]